MEFRKSFGFDEEPSFTDDLKFKTQGVRIHIFDPSFKDYFFSSLIDTSPGEAGNASFGTMRDAALKDGAEFKDEINKIKIKQLSHTSDSVSLQIAFNDPKLCMADIDRDGFINITDFSILSSCQGKKPGDSNANNISCRNADTDQNGIIDQEDLKAVKTYFGKINYYGKDCTVN